MNEEEYFDEIRRLKKRRVSEDQARQIVDAEKKREARTEEILEDKYVSVLDREKEESPFGSFADDYTDFFSVVQDVRQQVVARTTSQKPILLRR